MSYTKKYRIIIILLVIMAVVLAVGLLQFKAPNLTGTWKDIAEPYYVVFNEDGTYVESSYNIPLRYSVSDRKLVLYNANATTTTTTDLVKSFNGRVKVSINGVERILQKVNTAPDLFDWEIELSDKPVETYTLDNSYDFDYTLSFYEDNIFCITLDADKVLGKYAVGAEGNVYLYVDGDLYGVLDRWDSGFSFNKMDSQLNVSTVRENLFEDKGFLLSGSVFDQATGTLYEFSTDNIVLRRDSTGNSIELFYFVDMSGIIRLTDIAGLGVEDFLYYNQENGDLYRFVLQKDGWTEYLNGLGE